ncbi:MAG: phosphotransferase family protein [Marmoricola sp.]|nr:phosphotransferase family protein [Marmoricola sp.]
MTATDSEHELRASLEARVTASVETWRPGVGVREIRPLTGGSSSLTYVVALTDGERLVLKVAPPGLPPVRNRDVLRQARLMRALAASPAAVLPRSLFEDAGDPPGVPPYLAMDLLPGDCAEPVLQPPGERPTPHEVHARALDAARVLAALHSVEPATVGLGAEPVVMIADEIDRWTTAFRTVPTDLQGDFERCASMLHATVPPGMRPVVNHGDYRLGNTLCADGRVVAIIDWEIWSIGDPRIDVTWLTFFTDEAEHPAAEPGVPAGTPSKAELIAEYEAASGVPLADMAWFDALTKYKEAAATALLLKRGRRGGAMPPPMHRMVAGVPRLLDEVLAALG